jgi:KipI family sensor histidine kinase inhibitor
MSATVAATAVRRVGEGALLVTFDTLDDVIGFRADLDANPVRGIVEIVTAARSILVRVDRAHADRDRLAAGLLSRRAPAGGVQDPGANALEIPVVYDGEDLDEVGRLTGLGADGVIRAHSEQTWTSAFCGFAPGFSYLVGSETSMAVPRRSSPRTRVPEGAVGLAGEFSAVYPRSSPGGWQLIGRTEVSMWSLGRESPALAPAGTLVRFVPIGA